MAPPSSDDGNPEQHSKEREKYRKRRKIGLNHQTKPHHGSPMAESSGIQLDEK